MLCLNNNLKSPKSLNFKSAETKYIVKIGKNTIDSDTFINNIDRSIYKRQVRSYGDFLKVIKTCNFGRFMLQQTIKNDERELCQKVINRCVEDLERAIANRESKETVKKFSSILEKLLLIFNGKL